MKSRSLNFIDYLIFAIILLAVLFICVALGSVGINFGNTIKIFSNAITGAPQGALASSADIILSVRLPRVLCVACVGAALSVCGAAMQGLLKNPLADGYTLGVSSGASLGAIIAIAFGLTVNITSLPGTMVMAVIFAFGSLVIILALAYRFDSSLATNTIILIGIIFSMLASSISSFIITFAGEKIKSITFWTLGSFSASSYSKALILVIAVVICGVFICLHADELNAFSIGEENARSIGINVRRVRFSILIAASILIGICVSVCGTIGFVGLVVPHIIRLVTGPDHRKLLPASLFFGAVFLLLSDLIARCILSPRELPAGVVTSLVGSVVFIIIYFRSRKR